MNIGLLTTYLSLGADADSGIGQHYRVLADALAAQGHQVHVIHPTLRPEIASAELATLSSAWSCDVVPVRTPQWIDRLVRRSWPSRVLLAELCAAFAADRALVRAARQRPLDVIETHATGAPALVYLRRRRRAPVVTRVSTTLSQLNAASAIRSRIKDWQVGLERRAVRASDALVTHSGRHRDTICALEGYAADDFAIVPHGLPDISPSPPPTPAPPGDLPEILFVGRFEHRKGIDVLLRAIPLVLAACPAARFTLAGSQNTDPHWAEFLRAHPDRFGDRVRAPGRVSEAELTALYSRCTVFVAPSRYESFGLIYLEAMRHAKPVVGCLAGGIVDVVNHGVTGLLVPPGDAPALAEALIALLRDPSLRARLGQAGRADFTTRFGAAAMATASVALYRAVCARAVPTPT